MKSALTTSVAGGKGCTMIRNTASGAPDGNPTVPDNAMRVPRKLHVDIQGLSPEATAELRQRLALREGETLDHAALVKELGRIHQIVNEFDPHLSDGRSVAELRRKFGADGKLVPPDSMDITVIISPSNSAP